MSLKPIKYQTKNYDKVKDNNPDHIKALISLNADLRSIMFKEAGGENLDDPEVIKLKKKEEDLKKAHDKKRNLHLEDVENLKDKLANHLKEIKSLIGEEVEDDGSEDEDDRNLNAQIKALRKTIELKQRIIKGEDVVNEAIEDEI
jgi:hypothetical protein